MTTDELVYQFGKISRLHYTTSKSTSGTCCQSWRMLEVYVNEGYIPCTRVKVYIKMSQCHCR